jgi:hypothetical protein
LALHGLHGLAGIDTDTEAARTTPTRRPFGEPTRALVVAAAAIVVIVVVVVAGVAALTLRPPGIQAEPPPASASSTPASLPDPDLNTAGLDTAPEQRSGEVTDLAPEEGYDFDFGDRGGPEDRAGLDISGRTVQYTFDSLATTEGGPLKDSNNGGRLKLLHPRPTPFTRQDCNPAVPGWTKNVPGPPIGGSVCVVTSDGNIALLTVTKPWTGSGPQDRLISFSYHIWYM